MSQVTSGEKLFQQFDAMFPVKVAFWLKGSENPKWQLDIASESIDETNDIQGSLEVRRLTRAMPELFIDSDQVRVVGINDPVASAALELQKRYPTLRPLRYRGPQLGGVGTDEVYIDTIPATVTVS